MLSLSLAPRSKVQSKSGFSLVIALGLMAMIFTLLLSLTALVQLESRSSAISLQASQARQNALLGLQIALSELQAAAGPDQRSVARADVMAQHTGIALDGDDVPNNTDDARKYWVGVSHSDGTSTIAPSNQPVQWLVSGLEGASSAAQLTGALTDPVVLIGENSVDSGNEVSAGRVDILIDDVKQGAYAWIVDDETQKAKLVPSNREVNNETPSTLLDQQRHVLPGYYDLLETTGLSTDASSVFIASGLEDLEVGNTANEDLVRERFYDYTLTGFGVLADTRNGGLKRDLTAAFENADVFDDLFPDTSDTPYIAMDPDKFDDANDLKSNGYIHFGIFRDYYSLKDYVSADGTLPISVIDKALFGFGGPDNTRMGQVGPHNISEENHPYGAFEVWSGNYGTGNQAMNYQHNPITPVMSYFQQNAWAYRGDGIPIGMNRNDVEPVNACGYLGQIWFGIYNPYNVNLAFMGEDDGGQDTGPSLHGYPANYMTIIKRNKTNGTESIIFDRNNITNNHREIHTVDNEDFILAPGANQLLGFKDNVYTNSAQLGAAQSFSKDIQSAVDQASGRTNQGNLGPLDRDTYEFDMLVEFAFISANYGPNMGFGISHPNGADNGVSVPNEFQIAQIFYHPFLFDKIASGESPTDFDLRRDFSPGGSAKVYLRSGLELSNTGRMNPTEEAGYALRLRTTKETTSEIRPLIDANMRAIWNNPRWDNDMNLGALASYSVENELDLTNPFPDFTISGSEGFLESGNGEAERVILFDIPREPLVSIGQLQHAAAGRFSYEPSYIVGNSYANVRLPLNDWTESANDTYSTRLDDPSFDNFILPWRIIDPFNLYDASYLVNEALFDSYTFTTIPQSSTDAEIAEFLKQEDSLLQNPRYIPYEPEGVDFDASTLQSDTAGRTNAGLVLVDGAFNVNSTSVEAWEAFLSGTKGLPFQKMDADGEITGFDDVDGVRFPRVQTVLGDSWQNVPDDDYWIGFRSLDSTEIGQLATEIVRLIRERGPFHNLSDFINRALEDSEAGKSGVLQAALDATINNGLDSDYESPAATTAYDQIAQNSTQGAGFPGQLLQGDLLQALAPYMQTRSDTFKIRSYGETTNPVTGKVTGQAWCEAVVQRFPDPVLDSGSEADLVELESPTSSFGRQFQVVSFRWLDKDEV